MNDKTPPVFVCKDETSLWRWTCRRCSCSEWHGRHRDALAEAHRHLKAHELFGFKR